MWVSLTNYYARDPVSIKMSNDFSSEPFYYFDLTGSKLALRDREDNYIFGQVCFARFPITNCFVYSNACSIFLLSLIFSNPLWHDVFFLFVVYKPGFTIEAKKYFVNCLPLIYSFSCIFS